MHSDWLGKTKMEAMAETEEQQSSTSLKIDINKKKQRVTVL